MIIDISYTNLSMMRKTLSAAISNAGQHTCLHYAYNDLLDPVYASVYITVIKPGMLWPEHFEKQKTTKKIRIIILYLKKIVEEVYKLYKIHLI